MIEPGEVARRLGLVRDRIEGAGGDPDAITVVAVTKGFGADAVAAAVAAGLDEVGENYAQDLLGKVGAVSPEPRWHFIGRLQRNKVRAVAHVVDLWQTIDRAELAREVARRAAGAEVLLQVNATAEPGKGGCPAAGVPGLVQTCLDLGLTVKGLMVVGPTEGGPEAARPAFRLVRTVADDLGLPVRSMGMTGDLEVAVAEGSTMLRLGTALFGDRPRR